MPKCENTNSNTTCPPPFSYVIANSPIVVGRIPIPPSQRICNATGHQAIENSVDANIDISAFKRMGSLSSLANAPMPMGAPENTGSHLTDEEDNRNIIPDEVLIKTNAKRRKAEINNIIGTTMMTDLFSSVCNTSTSIVKDGKITAQSPGGRVQEFKSFQEARNALGSSFTDSFNNSNIQDVFDNWENLNTETTVDIWTTDESALKNLGVKIAERGNISVHAYPIAGLTSAASQTTDGGVEMTANEQSGGGTVGRGGTSGNTQTTSWTLEDVNFVNDITNGSALFLRGGLGLGINYMNENGFGIQTDLFYSRNIATLIDEGYRGDGDCENMGIVIVGEYNFCWVAREVYGPTNPAWLQFRKWMFNESPQWFFNLYRKYGERFASWISNKPRLKGIIRKWMDSKIGNKKLFSNNK